jgi:hypothetical protein
VIARRHRVGQVPEELGSGRGGQVADRAAEERDEPRAAVGELTEVRLEVADDRVDRDPVLVGDRGRRGPQGGFADVEGGEGAQRPRASRSSRVFSEVPEPSSTSVSGRVAAAISDACAARMARSARVG